jgi:hypothetical protein
MTPLLVTREAHEDAYALLGLFKIIFDRTPDGEYVLWVDADLLSWVDGWRPEAGQSRRDATAEIIRIARILIALP